MTDLYAILDVPRDATEDDIKQAYRRQARKYHPDLNKEPDAEARFKEVGNAYDVLGNPKRRARYDAGGGDDDNAEALATMMVVDVLRLFADKDGAVGRARAHLRDEIAAISAGVASLRQRIRGLEKRKDRTKAKTGPNLVHGLLDEMIRSIQAEIHRAEARADCNRAATKLLDDYEDVPDPDAIVNIAQGRNATIDNTFYSTGSSWVRY